MATELTTARLCYLRSLLTQGCPADLLGHLQTRCGATQADHDALVAAGWVGPQRGSRGRVVVTKAGQAAYRRGRVGRYF